MPPRKPTTPTRERPLVLAYARVSTAEQADEGASLDAQAATLTAECARRGWDCQVIQETGSAKDLRRPQLVEALARLDRGEADILLAVRLDRISRSVVDFGSILIRARQRGWSVNLLDLALDMTTPSGKFTAQIMAAAAEHERALIGVRTAEGMAQRRREGAIFGRPRNVPDDIRDRIVTELRAGRSYGRIAEGLTRDEIPTARGGRKWWPTTVRDIAQSAVTLRITDPAASDATEAVLTACGRWLHPGSKGDRSGAVRQGAPLPPGVTVVTITAEGYPDVAPAIAAAENSAPAGWSVTVTSGTSPRADQDELEGAGSR